MYTRNMLQFNSLLLIAMSLSLISRAQSNKDNETLKGNFTTVETSGRADVSVIDSISGCICVQAELCKQDNYDKSNNNDDKLSNGEGFLDIRFTRNVCKNYFEVCCFDLAVEDLSASTNNNNAANNVGPLGGCGFGLPMGMGYRITSDGTNVQFGELPWTVMVLQEKDSKSMYKCGGSLIHPQVVMTAAHCLEDGDFGWAIRAGEWNTRSEDELLPHQDRTVREVVAHPNYQSGSLRNDLVLLILETPVTLAENVNVVCLPSGEYQLDSNADEAGVLCVAGGWGKDAFKKGKHSSILKKVELPLVSRDECLRSLRSTRLGQYYHLDQSFICAGGEKNRDTCKGDGGSPLVCPVPGQPRRYVQVGIVSWGIGCGDETPGVYANVALYTDWIDEQLEAFGFDTSLYKY